MTCNKLFAEVIDAYASGIDETELPKKDLVQNTRKPSPCTFNPPGPVLYH